MQFSILMVPNSCLLDLQNPPYTLTPIDYGNDKLKKLHFFVSNFPKIILDELLWCPMPSQGKNEIFFFWCHDEISHHV